MRSTFSLLAACAVLLLLSSGPASAELATIGATASVESADCASVASTEALVDFGQLPDWMTTSFSTCPCRASWCQTTADCWAACPTAFDALCVAGRCIYNC